MGMASEQSTDGTDRTPYIIADVNMSWKIELPGDYDEDDIRNPEELEDVLADELGVSHREGLFDVEITASREIVNQPVDTGIDQEESQ